MKCLMTILTGICMLWMSTLNVSADEAGIRKFLTAYIDAFNGQNAEAVTGMWSETSSHLDRDTGERTEGRAAILEELPALFAAEQKPRLTGTVSHIRFVTPEVAQVEGTISVGTAGEIPAESTFSAIVIKHGDAWQFDSVEEADAVQARTAADALQQLAWLEGSWVDESDAGKIAWTFRWSAGNNFLTRVVTQADGDELTRLGTDVVGWDPRSQQIRSWSFHADGSFGDGVWSMSGDEWIIRSSQTLSDGRASSGTYVVKRTGDDSLTVKLIGHDIDGEPQPASDPVTMTRAAAESDAAETKAIRAAR